MILLRNRDPIAGLLGTPVTRAGNHYVGRTHVVFPAQALELIGLAYRRRIVFSCSTVDSRYLFWWNVQNSLKIVRGRVRNSNDVAGTPDRGSVPHLDQCSLWPVVDWKQERD